MKVVDQSIKKAGSKAMLAKLCGVTRQAVGQWKQIPLKHVDAICSLLGMLREEVRPDVYGERR